MIERAPFGRTGHHSSRLVFGAAALATADDARADRALGMVLEAGVNHLDTAASYGCAEERMGPWISRHRGEVFLATKTGKRTRNEAMAELERSLRLLRTDHVDLWQMHCLVDEVEWETAFGPGGVLEAMIEAKEKGMTRFLGVTGHGKAAPAMHLRSIRRFGFDSVLFPWNWCLSLDADYAASVRELIAACRDRRIAVQLIKAFCRRPWGERERTRTTWYEPVVEPRDVEAVLGWAFAVPGAFVPSAGDTGLLPTILAAAAAAPVRPSEEGMRAMATRLGMEDLFA